jgi:hypothetical protein
MNRFTIAPLLLTCGIAFASPQNGTTRHSMPSASAGAVNAICPVGKEPIDGRTFITDDDQRVGFCCPGCEPAFLGWTKERRDSFIIAAAGGSVPSQPAPDPKDRPAAPAKPGLSALYPLADCPISGQLLGSMGDPVIRTWNGREVRFCYSACVPKFEQNQKAELRKLDEKIIAMQLPYYPLEMCIVAGGRLGSMGEPDSFVHQNRLVRFCCAGCRDGFEKSAPEFIAKLDKAAADEQRPTYPLQTCVVRGNTLGSMGNPAEVILAGRLVRLCCAPCEKELRANPARYIASLDEAWRKAGRPGLPAKGDR